MFLLFLPHHIVAHVGSLAGNKLRGKIGVMGGLRSCTGKRLVSGGGRAAYLPKFGIQPFVVISICPSEESKRRSTKDPICRHPFELLLSCDTRWGRTR